MWREILPGLREHVRRTDNGWSFRTIAVDLKGGGCAVYSPTRKVDPGDLDVRFLVAPNHFHYLGIPEWSARFPGARILSSDGARPRLESKLGKKLGSLGEVDLLPGMQWVDPQGTKNGEVWLAAGGAWIVCDAFFNEPKNPTGMFGIGCRLTGTTPGLRIGGTWPLLHLQKRAVYKQWLRERLAEAPSRLVPSHGDIAEGSDLGERLRALADRL